MDSLSIAVRISINTYMAIPTATHRDTTLSACVSLQYTLTHLVSVTEWTAFINHHWWMHNHPPVLKSMAKIIEQHEKYYERENF